MHVCMYVCMGHKNIVIVQYSMKNKLKYYHNQYELFSAGKTVLNSITPPIVWNRLSTDCVNASSMNNDKYSRRVGYI